jgi:hypothetical protein
MYGFIQSATGRSSGFLILVVRPGKLIHHRPLTCLKVVPIYNSAKLLARMGHSASNASIRPLRMPRALLIDASR